jgi:hypothetical protein
MAESFGHSDGSVSRLFSQLVSLKLAQIMDGDEDFWGYDSCPVSLEVLENRIQSVENNQRSMMDLLQQLISRLDAIANLQYSSVVVPPPTLPLQSSQIVSPVPPIQTVVSPVGVPLRTA